MESEKQAIFGKFGNPVTVRFSDGEAKFIIENYEDITGSSEMELSARAFFMKAVENACSKKPIEKEVPRKEDQETIEKQAKEIEELTGKLETLTQQYNKVLKDMELLQATVEQETSEKEKIASTVEMLKVESKGNLSDTEILLTAVDPRYKYVLLDICQKSTLSITDVLINKMFSKWLRNPGDTGLERYRPKNMKEIDKYFDEKQK